MAKGLPQHPASWLEVDDTLAWVEVRLRSE